MKNTINWVLRDEYWYCVFDSNNKVIKAEKVKLVHIDYGGDAEFISHPLIFRYVDGVNDEEHSITRNGQELLYKTAPRVIYTTEELINMLKDEK